MSMSDPINIAKRANNLHVRSTKSNLLCFNMLVRAKIFNMARFRLLFTGQYGVILWYFIYN